MRVSNKIPAIEVVDSLLVRTDDMQGIKRARYMSVLKDVWKDMELAGIKDTKRIIVKVNKSTNTIMLPEEADEFASIYGFVNGRMEALLINTDLSEDLVDLSAHKSCGHEDCKSDLCATVKNYELIEEVVLARMPDGNNQSFTKVSRKKINPDGSFILEVQEPIAKYTNGVHTSTEMNTSTEFICHLEVNEHGCVNDCEDNRKKVYENCVFCNIEHESGMPIFQDQCYNPNLTYNVSQDGRRIILPSNLSLSDVIVRFYYTQKTKDIMIPTVCKKLMMMKLKFELMEFDDKISASAKILLTRSIHTEESKMLRVLLRMTLAQLYHTITPKRHLN